MPGIAAAREPRAAHHLDSSSMSLVRRRRSSIVTLITRGIIRRAPMLNAELTPADDLRNDGK
jgi:hypothetical protein